MPSGSCSPRELCARLERQALVFHLLSNTKDQNFLYVVVFYTDSCSYDKSIFILLLNRNYCNPGLVHNFNVRQYVSSIVVKRIRSQPLC